MKHRQFMRLIAGALIAVMFITGCGSSGKGAGEAAAEGASASADAAGKSDEKEATEVQSQSGNDGESADAASADAETASREVEDVLEETQAIEVKEGYTRYALIDGFEYSIPESWLDLEKPANESDYIIPGVRKQIIYNVSEAELVGISLLQTQPVDDKVLEGRELLEYCLNYSGSRTEPEEVEYCKITGRDAVKAKISVPHLGITHTCYIAMDDGACANCMYMYKDEEHADHMEEYEYLLSSFAISEKKIVKKIQAVMEAQKAEEEAERKRKEEEEAAKKAANAKVDAVFLKYLSEILEGKRTFSTEYRLYYEDMLAPG